MPVSVSSRAVFVAGAVLLLAFATGGATAAGAGPSTVSVDTVDWSTEADGEPAATDERLTDPVEDLRNATDDEGDTGAAGELDPVDDEFASEPDTDTDGTDPLEVDSIVDDSPIEGEIDDTASVIGGVLRPGGGAAVRVNGSSRARLDVETGPANASVQAGIDPATIGEEPTETGDSNGSSGPVSAGSGNGPGDTVDAGLVGALGGLTLLGGAGAAGSGATAGAAAGATGATAGGSAGATSRLVGRTLGTLLRLLGGVSGLAYKLPLGVLRYSRYDGSDPLEHDTRRNLYERIEAEPGRYLSALDASVEVSLSTIRHHLSVLEDEGLVEARKQHGKRRFYPVRSEAVELAAALDEPAKAGVLTVLAELDEAPNGRIADALDVDPSTVSHHLSALEDDGLVERHRDGRAVVNTLAPGVADALDERTDTGSATERTGDGPVAVYSDD
ncbi:winged helix-turn-helix transcriptional regulator [Halovivax cerinus]|uniref:Winged helix-turn-helix transcriptional regulator n=1 Tax=Halovivax cerinus TaxID=1487865 RepID=A0ABD5NNW3_9EURY|nr:helix-turn-helix domain-containing protein [Halovivax cerinus]